MNMYQLHAMQLLEKLLQAKEGKKFIRSKELLCRVSPLIERTNIPKDEFCRGWFYDVGTCFTAALDCELQASNKK